MNRRVTCIAQHTPEILAIFVPLVYCLFFLAPARNLPPDHALLGLVHTDQVVYYALAREAFESGNGLVYASPYSNLPDSPRIYSHFGFLVIGYIWKATRLSLPSLDYLLRAVLGAAMMLLAVRFFRAALPKRAPVLFGAAGVIVLSGIAWLIALLQYAQDTLLGAGAPSLEGYIYAFKQAESGYGEWYLNIFGNLTFVHELMFHVLFFGAALALVKQRGWLATILLFLTWWSHPYTGLQLGLIIAAFYLTEILITHRSNPSAHSSIPKFLVALGINALFIAYYLLFLPRFAEHASVYAQMRQFSHPMLFSKLLPAYGLFLLLPLLYAGSPDFRRLLKQSPAARLMLGWLFITAGLVFHDRILFFIKPFQPMHFTRGYLFVPLFYFSICAMGWLRDRYHWSPRKSGLLLTLLFLLQLPDNVIRTLQFQHDAPIQQYLYSIPRRDLALLERIDAVEPTMTIHAVGNNSLERMIPVLTHHRAFYGHLYNTPFRDEKARKVEELDEKLDLENLRALHVDALVITAPMLERLRTSIGQDQFRIIFQREEYCMIKIVR